MNFTRKEEYLFRVLFRLRSNPNENNSLLIKTNKPSFQYTFQTKKFYWFNKLYKRERKKEEEEEEKERKGKKNPSNSLPRKLHENLDGKLHTSRSKSLRHESLGESGVSKRDLDEEAPGGIGP